MKKIKYTICLAAGIIALTAVNASANTAAATDNKSQTTTGVVQEAQSAAALMNLAQSVLENAAGAYKLTPLAVPEPATMTLAGLGAASLLLFRRQRKGK